MILLNLYFVLKGRLKLLITSCVNMAWNTHQFRVCWLKIEVEGYAGRENVNKNKENSLLRGEKLNYKSVAKEIWKPPFFGSWSPVGTESLPCLFDSRFL